MCIFFLQGGVVNKNIGDAFLAVWKVKRVANHDQTGRSRRGSMFAGLGGSSSGSSSSGGGDTIVQIQSKVLSKSSREMFVDLSSDRSSRLMQSGGKMNSDDSESDTAQSNRGQSCMYATNAIHHPARSANAISTDDNDNNAAVDASSSSSSSSASDSLIVENVENVEIEEMRKKKEKEKVQSELERRDERYVHFLSNSYSVIDDALLSFLKIRRALMIDPRIQKVASNIKLQNKLPGFTVRMGYVESK